MALPFCFCLCLCLGMGLTLKGDAVAQPAAPPPGDSAAAAAAGKAAATEAEPWIEVPASIVEAFQLHGVGSHLLSAEAIEHGNSGLIRRLLGVDDQVAWLMRSMLQDYLHEWAALSHSVRTTGPGYTWELRIYPQQHAQILDSLRARADAFLTPPQRELFDLLCMIEMRGMLNMTSILVHETEAGGVTVQLRPRGGGLVMHSPKENPHSFMVQLRDKARHDERPDPQDHPAPIDPAKLYTPGQTVRMPLSLVRESRWTWTWGFITDDFSLSPLAKSLLTKEQAKALVTGMNAFLMQARTHERSLAKYETRKDGALVITVEPSPPATAQAQLQHVQDLLKQTLGDATVPYYLLEPGIMKEVRQTFPCLTGDSKQLTHLVQDGVISFERKLGKDSHPSKSNYVHDTEQHLLKDTTAAAAQQKKE